ncbi:hypothetical protein DPEC_G00154220 [Dallia pectoralis]|uniref:Uncharacterized protein n=1 Tax=Dallia pectoralis TaxID=75939 RepID=A0ACC2GKC1_DALPE|nr:hypothetical protein DPEC_G00154220 [Dallia pectoralis]
MDSKGPNFTIAETHALLEAVRGHYASIVGRFNYTKGGEVTNKKKKDIWFEITQNVNAIGSGQKRTTEQVKFRWKNLRARATKDHAEEAKNTLTGSNKPFRRGDYTDVVLDIIAGENLHVLHGIHGVVGNGEPTGVEESQPVPPNAEEPFILDLSPVIEEGAGSALVEPVVVATGTQTRGLKRYFPNQDDDAYESLMKREAERAEIQIRLAEEQITLTQILQTKAKLEVRLLKAGLQKADLSTNEEEL